MRVCLLLAIMVYPVVALLVVQVEMGSICDENYICVVLGINFFIK